MDFGNYLYAPDKQEGEFNRCVRRMRRFVQKHAPEFIAEYDERVERFAR